MYTQIRSRLLDGEYVLWEGQPRNKIFTSQDIFFVPFSLMWGGFAFFWEFSVIKHGPLIFMIWGIPFVLVGIYMIFGRFIYRSYVNKNTYYYVTDKRLIIIKALKKETISSVYYKTIPALTKKINSDGSGSLIFGDGNAPYGIYQNTGMDFLMNRNLYRKQASGFYNIEDIERVYRLIQNQITEAEDRRFGK